MGTTAQRVPRAELADGSPVGELASTPCIDTPLSRNKVELSTIHRPTTPTSKLFLIERGS